MGALKIMRDNFIANENARIKALGFDDRWLIAEGDLIGNDKYRRLMMNEWHKLNPMPVISDINSFRQARAKAKWCLKRDAASYYFYHGTDYPISIKKYDYNIEQAIINRKAGDTMLYAAL